MWRYEAIILYLRHVKLTKGRSEEVEDANLPLSIGAKHPHDQLYIIIYHYILVPLEFMVKPYDHV